MSSSEGTIPERYEGEEFTLSDEPWVAGTRAASYMGPVHVALWAKGGALTTPFEDTLCELLALLEELARDLGGNAVVGVEVTVNPFAQEGEMKGTLFYAIGTVGFLEPLFAWPAHAERRRDRGDDGCA